VVGCEDPPDCIARRAMATTATIATAAIIARFLFGMSRGWLCGKNLFAMFNSGYIDAVRHSLRHNSYECYLCPAVVRKSSSLGGLTLSVQDAASLSSWSVSGRLLKTTPRRGGEAGVGVVDLLQVVFIVWPGIDLGWGSVATTW